MADTRPGAAKDWCFTWFIPDGHVWEEDSGQEVMDTLVNMWNSAIGVTSLVFQLERCPNTERLHLQGFVQFAKRIRMHQAKEALKPQPALCSIHLEKRRGTAGQAWQYCTKAETRVAGPFTFGRVRAQGRRSDMSSVVEALNESPCAETLVAQVLAHPGMLRYIPHMEKFTQLVRPKRQQRTWVVWVHGPAGSGKDFFVKEYLNLLRPGARVYVKNNDEWWDGYDQEDVVLWDNFDPNIITYDSFCKLGDDKAIKVRIKGGSVNFTSRFLFITTVWNPADYYQMCRKKLTSSKPEEYSRRTITVPFNRQKRDKYVNINMYLHDEADDKIQDYGYTDPNPFPGERVIRGRIEAAKVRLREQIAAHRKRSRPPPSKRESTLEPTIETDYEDSEEEEVYWEGQKRRRLE